MMILRFFLITLFFITKIYTENEPILLAQQDTLTESVLETHTPYRGNLLFPTFKASMLRDDYYPDQYKKRQQLYASANPKFVKIFEDLYEKAIQEIEKDPLHLRIPKIIHQIWIGSPVPEKYRFWMESWMNMIGWKYFLWTENEISTLSLRNKDLYERSTNFGEKSDILRLEILYRYGGLYVDTDFECIRPDLFERLHHCCDFYVGFEALEHGSIGKFNIFKICNALIAAIPYHPLIDDLITNMRANYKAYVSHAGPVGKTGPNYLTRIICEYIESNTDTHRNLFLPSTFFYPISAIDVQNYCADPSYYLPHFEETIGIHYWNMSWMKHYFKGEKYSCEN